MWFDVTDRCLALLLLRTAAERAPVSIVPCFTRHASQFGEIGNTDRDVSDQAYREMAMLGVFCRFWD